MLLTGPLIFSSDPNIYIHSYSVLSKMVALLVAILNNYTVHRTVAMADASPGVTDVVNQFRVRKRAGFCIIVTMGALLASPGPLKYAPNPFFWAKMSLLVLAGVQALIFWPRGVRHRRYRQRAHSATRAKLAGGWALAGALAQYYNDGSLIGYWEDPGSPGNPTGAASASHVVAQLAMVGRAPVR